MTESEELDHLNEEIKKLEKELYFLKARRDGINRKREEEFRQDVYKALPQENPYDWPRPMWEK